MRAQVHGELLFCSAPCREAVKLVGWLVPRPSILLALIPLTLVLYIYLLYKRISRENLE